MVVYGLAYTLDMDNPVFRTPKSVEASPDRQGMFDELLFGGSGEEE